MSEKAIKNHIARLNGAIVALKNAEEIAAENTHSGMDGEIENPEWIALKQNLSARIGELKNTRNSFQKKLPQDSGLDFLIEESK